MEVFMRLGKFFAPATQQAYRKLTACPEHPAWLQFRLSRLSKAVNAEMERHQEVMRSIAEKHAKKDENGKPVTKDVSAQRGPGARDYVWQSPEAEAAYFQEAAELEKEEFTVELSFNLKDIRKARLTAQEIALLDEWITCNEDELRKIEEEEIANEAKKGADKKD
jgi:hypothetical protein